MTADLVNQLQIHRQANFTKSFLRELKSIQSKLLRKHPKLLFHRAYYLNPTTPIRVLCRSHGFFSQTPANLLEGISCPTCEVRQARKQRFMYQGRKYSQSSFTAACTAANGYDYSQTQFTGFHKPIHVFCPVHRYIKVNRPHLCLSSKFQCPRCKGYFKVIN